jgi:hypothetical protein
MRPVWQRYAPLAAAAMLLMGVGALSWPERASASATQATEKSGLVAEAKPEAARPTPSPTAIPITPVQIAHNEPVEVEVMAIPGSTPNQPHYLVRKGEQVLFIDPAAAQQHSTQAPEAAQAASFRRY